MNKMDGNGKTEATDLVYTSVSDCNSALMHVKSLDTLTQARDLSESLGYQSKVQIIEREIRKRARS